MQIPNFRSSLKLSRTPSSQSPSPFDCQALHEMLLEAHEAELSGKISGKELPLKCNSRSQVLMYMCFYCALFSFKSDLSLLAFVALIFQFRKNLQVHQTSGRFWFAGIAHKFTWCRSSLFQRKET